MIKKLSLLSLASLLSLSSLQSAETKFGNVRILGSLTCDSTMSFQNSSITQASLSGLTTSDTPSFYSATLTGRPLQLSSGGTGATSASAARTSLGLGNVENTALSSWAGSANITTLGTISTGTIPQANVSGLTTSDTASFLGASLTNPLPVASGGTGARSSSAARSSLGLGTIATQDGNNVSISGGSISGITDLAIADGGTGSSTAAAAIVAIGGKAANGFVDRTNSTLGMSGSTFQVTTGSSYDFYTAGTKYTKSTTQSVSISSDLTLHYVYFDTSGVLQVSAGTAWSITSDNVPVAMVYKDGGTYIISDERHGWKRDRDWHAWAHETIGARWHTGLAATFTDTTLSVTSGEIDDEDIHLSISTQLDSPRIWFRNSTTSMKVRPSNKKPYASLSGTDIAYDASGTLTQVTNNQYTCVYLYATNDQSYPLYIVAGQAQHTTIANARAEALPTIQLPSAEWKLLYKAIYKSNGASAPTYQEASDFRTTQTLALTATATDHQSLANREAANAHPQAAITGLTTSDTATFLGANLANPLPIASGGTAATTAANARSSLGAEAAITAGTTAQYWRGDKSFQTLNQAAVSDLTTSDTPSFLGVNVTGSMPPANGIYKTSTANNLAFATNSTERMRIDSSGNVGIGTTPSAWDASLKSLQINPTFVIYSKSGESSIGENHYYNGSSNIYNVTGYATMYRQSSGTHTWFTAPSGNAGTTATMTQRMVIDNSGNVGIGVTPSAWNTANRTATQIGADCYIAGTKTTSSLAEIGANVYLDQNSIEKYINTNYASKYRQLNGAHYFYTASSGTAGNAITFTETTKIDNSGNVIIGTGGLFVSTSKTPSSATDTGTTGQIAWDANYIYICVGTNSWKRAAIASW